MLNLLQRSAAKIPGGGATAVFALVLFSASCSAESSQAKGLSAEQRKPALRESDPVAPAVPREGQAKGAALSQGDPEPDGDSAERGPESDARMMISGTVVDLESGKPIAGVLVSCESNSGVGTPNSAVQSTSGPDGKFELARLGPEECWLNALPQRAQAKLYWPFRQPTLQPRPAHLAEQRIEIVRRRIAPRQSPGELGFEVSFPTPGQSPHGELKVSSVREDSPAARAGIKEGDVIVSVDGHDTTGFKIPRFTMLTRVKPGTSLRVGLHRGEEIDIVAVPRHSAG